jgi:hypothetical protein
VATSTEHEEITETPIENFVATMKFIANNDLWDEAQRAVEKAGIGTIQVSSAPIRVFRELVKSDLLTGDRLGATGQKHAQVIAECGCGMANPGPGHGPVSPTGGGDAGAGDGGTPQVLPSE